MGDFTVSGGTNTAPLVATFEDMRTFSDQLAGVQSFLAAQSTAIARMAANSDLLESAILSPVTAADAETRILQAAAVYLTQAARVTVLHLFIDGAIITYETADSALAAAANGLYFVGGFAAGVAGVGVGVFVGAGAVVVAGAAAVYGVGVGVAYQVGELADSTGAAVAAIGDQVQSNPWLLATLLVPGEASVLIASGAGAFASTYSPGGAAAAANQRLATEFANLLALAPDMASIQSWARENTDLIQTLVKFAPGLLAGATSVFGPSANVGLTGVTGAPWPPLTYDQLVESLIVGGGRFGVFNDATGQPTVTPKTFVDAKGVKLPQIVPTDLNSLFRGADEIDINGDPTMDDVADFSDIRIVERVDANGSHHWIVQIPSTQNWSLVPGAVTNDLPSDLAASAQQQTVLMQAVKDAMTQAGIGSGDPVMLTGFSLGGITAGLMGSDTWVNSHYNVTHVVTAGSPIGNFDIPSTVSVLSFEHTGDLVTATEGMHNPATTNQVTVHADPPMIDADLEPHNARKYAVTAEEFQNSGDPNADKFTDTTQGFFAGGTATVLDYAATR